MVSLCINKLTLNSSSHCHSWCSETSNSGLTNLYTGSPINTGSQKVAQIIVSSGNLQISIIVSSVGQKTSKNIPKQSKIWVNFRCFSNTSECIRTCPNASKWVRTGPNRSERVRKHPKTSNTIRNHPNKSENFRKFRDRRANFSDAALVVKIS